MRKIFLIIILLLISTFSFGETIDELTNRLEESTKTINELVEVINDKNDKIIKLETSNKDLILQLEKSNSTINLLINRIQKDQEEITKLRKLLEETSNYVEEDNSFFVGGNISYPLGGQILFGVDLKIVPLNIYSVFHIDKDLYISSGIGVLYEF